MEKQMTVRLEGQRMKGNKCSKVDSERSVKSGKANGIQTEAKIKLKK